MKGVPAFLRLINAVRGRCAVSTAFLCAFVLLLAACGSSADPQSWEEAEAEGSVRENFMNTCVEITESLANSRVSDSAVSAAEAEINVYQEYCGCVFNEYVITLEYEEFQELESALKLNPDPGALDKQEVHPTAAASWEKSQHIRDNCASKSET